MNPAGAGDFQIERILAPTEPQPLASSSGGGQARKGGKGGGAVDMEMAPAEPRVVAVPDPQERHQVRGVCVGERWRKGGGGGRGGGVEQICPTKADQRATSPPTHTLPTLACTAGAWVRAWPPDE